MDRQLADQEDGINRLTVKEWINNRNDFIRRGRHPDSDAYQQVARQKARSIRINEFIDQGISSSEAVRLADEWMDTQAALYSPDQIAVGYADRITCRDSRSVNCAISSQWKTRIWELDRTTRELYESMNSEQRRITNPNVRLGR